MQQECFRWWEVGKNTLVCCIVCPLLSWLNTPHLGPLEEDGGDFQGSIIKQYYTELPLRSKGQTSKYAFVCEMSVSIHSLNSFYLGLLKFCAKFLSLLERF